jgi:PadR family transcriptional regulator, regulatory protein PadR
MYNADMKLNKDLVAAYAAPLVLSLLEDGESYGYAVIQRVRELSRGAVEWTDGMLYPVLHRLEAQGHIQARWGASETGRRRKYYALQKTGRLALAEQKEQWRVVAQTLGQLWEELTWKTSKGRSSSGDAASPALSRTAPT